MAMAQVRINQPALDRFIALPSGPVARNVTLRATGVQERTRRVIADKTNNHPAVVGTLVKRVLSTGSSFVVLVGAVRTGPRVIRPVQAQALRFKPKGVSVYVFAKSVNHPGTGPLFKKYLIESARYEGLQVRGAI